MKRTVLFFFLVVSAANAFLTAPSANAITYSGYTSEIEGVGLWTLSDYNGNVVCSLSLKDNPEFATFCDGKNKLYIYEKGSAGFVCKTVKVEWENGNPKIEDLDDSGRKEILKNIELAKKGQYEGTYDVLLIRVNKLDSSHRGFYTVSKKKLVKGKWTVSAPSKDEMKSSAKIAANNQKEIRRKKEDEIKKTYGANGILKSESVIGYNDKRLREMDEWNSVTENNAAYTVKIKTRNIEIIIVPTLFIMDKDSCCDIISTVVLKKNNEYRFLGHINGWMMSVGADIDSDGVPEVIIEQCGCVEGDSIIYLKIYPVIKTLMGWGAG